MGWGDVRARYKPYDYAQSKLIPMHIDRQVVPGTFEYTLSYLIEHECDLSGFEARYHNDETGAPAYEPAILLKIVLFAYLRGMTSSRVIARACEENVVFMALSADSRPHFTTIASFIAWVGDLAVRLLRDVLRVCDEQGLIGREMFAVDGVKLPSNASKEWSGTRADFQRKAVKMEAAVAALVSRHRRADSRGPSGSAGRDDDDSNDDGLSDREQRTLARLETKLAKVKAFLDNGEEKLGRQGKPVKSNLTDAESAMMASTHGVIQGYVGGAVVDGEHQVIVSALAFGEAQEQARFCPLLEQTREHVKGARGRMCCVRRAWRPTAGFIPTRMCAGWPRKGLMRIWRTIGCASTTRATRTQGAMTWASRCGAMTRGRSVLASISPRSFATTRPRDGAGARRESSLR